MQDINITVGDEVFQFSDFENWCDTAKRKFSSAGLHSEDTICVDSWGRVCICGKEFMRARDDGSYPVRVFESLCG